MRSKHFPRGLYTGVPAFVLCMVGLSGTAVADLNDAPAGSWNAPAWWTPPAPEASGRHALVGGPTALPFIALPPCRLVDTRGNAPLGGGFLPAATVRSYVLAGVCGVPADALGISLNATVVKPTGPGFLTLWPQGGSFPPVSTLNFLGNDVIVNSAVVPLGPAGGISMALGVSGGDVILDTNGYYALVPSVKSLNALTGDLTLQGSGGVTVTPGAGAITISAPAGVTSVTGANGISASPASGAVTVTSNATFLDTANTLVSRDPNGLFAAKGINLTGPTLSGGFVLLAGEYFLHAYGGGNTFLGSSAGNHTLTFATAGGNAGVGRSALTALTEGAANTAVGYYSGSAITTGQENTAIGWEALQSITDGIQNTALGYLAGSNLTSGSNNVYIGNPGLASESDTIRIGSGSGGITPQHTKFFLAAVRGVTTGIPNGIPVLIDSFGQLGTATSSIRFKDDVRDMGDESAKLMQLRPVTFRYKAHGPAGTKQYGLIAEEVDEVMPELVARSKDGEIETVMYHELPALLLNEIQRLEKRIAELEKRLSASGDGR
jgi:hypothetical protein